MKRPAEEGHLQRTDTGRKCRVGYKDFRQLALALSPHVHERFFSNYTTDRNMKQIDKKRLCSRSFALFIVEEPVLGLARTSDLRGMSGSHPAIPYLCFAYGKSGFTRLLGTFPTTLSRERS